MPFLLASILGGIAGSNGEQDQNWPQWRGPSADGSSTSAAPPVSWSESQNVRWKTEIRGEGASTPIVWGDQVFVLSARATERRPAEPTRKDPRSLTEPPNRIFEFLVTSVRRASGRILWQRIATAVAPHEGHHETNTYAGGSPATDGERLYVSFGSRGVYCYDLHGALLWQKDLGKMRTRLGWGEASTPVVHGHNLLIAWDQENQSFLYNLDPRTGEILWRVSRDEPTNWSTPLVTEYRGRVQVVVNGTHRARGYDLKDGGILWECGNLSVNAIPSPTRCGDLVVCMSGYRKSIVYAIPLGSAGDISGSDQVAWTYARNSPYVASPALYRGWLYFTRQRSAVLTILDAANGDVILDAERLPGLRNIYASPVAAAGRIYFLDREGTAVVLKHGREMTVLATNRLDGTFDASPAIVGGQIFLRSRTHLYCIQ